MILYNRISSLFKRHQTSLINLVNHTFSVQLFGDLREATLFSYYNVFISYSLVWRFTSFNWRKACLNLWNWFCSRHSEKCFDSNLGKITGPNQSLLDQNLMKFRKKWKNLFSQFYLLNTYSLQTKTVLFTCMDIPFYCLTVKTLKKKLTWFEYLF